MTPTGQRIGTDAVAVDCGNELGEGPVWDAAAGALLWVDLLGGAVESWNPRSGEHRRHAHPPPVGAVAPRQGGGRVVAAGRELLALAGDGTVESTLVTVEPDLPSNHFNDCRCDSAGRLWAGTMTADGGAPGTGSVYRIGADLVPRRMIAATTISNGIGWDPTDRWMYFIDSATFRLDAFEFDAASGEVGDRRPVATIDPEDGLPDGLAVDAEGGIWIALFDGGRLHRYTADGTLDAVLELPVRHPTCPAFGGAGMETLYVTSGRYTTAAISAADTGPAAGALLALDVGVAGVPAVAFGVR